MAERIVLIDESFGTVSAAAIAESGSEPVLTTPVPPNFLQNSSCYVPAAAATAAMAAATAAILGSSNQFSLVAWLSTATVTSVLRTLVILALTFAVIFCNIFLIVTLNSSRYGKFIHSQARYLITSLAINDFFMGLLVLSLTIIPSLTLCWPYGEVICQIQALLRVALSQQSAIILICMALDRYVFLLHFSKYHQHSSKKGCVAVISLTWIVSLVAFSCIILPKNHYYFSSSGLYGCEPLYSHASIRILAACSFYFPTTMILMYCYGSAFHANQMRFIDQKIVRDGGTREHNFNCILYEKKFNANISKTMTAISLVFIIFATPWTIQEVVEACTGSKAPAFVDSFTTWLLLSNSFWNPFLYWIFNRHFRNVVRDMFCAQVVDEIVDIATATSGTMSAVQTVNSLPHDNSKPPDTLDRTWDDILELSSIGVNQSKTN